MELALSLSVSSREVTNANARADRRNVTLAITQLTLDPNRSSPEFSRDFENGERLFDKVTKGIDGIVGKLTRESVEV